MFFGFDVSGMIAGMSQLFQGVPERLIIILVIAVLGVVGRYFFVAFASSLKVTSPVRSFSGGSMLGVGALLVFALLTFVGHSDRIAPSDEQDVPFLVSDQNSCDFTRSDRCVILFEEGREISVSPLDRRLSGWKRRPAEQGAVAHSLRPESRIRQDGSPDISSVTWASSKSGADEE